MMLPMRLLDAVTPLPFQGGLDLPGAVAFAAVAPDRAHVAGDRIRTLRPGMPGHPVTGGAGNTRHPASRRYRAALARITSTFGHYPYPYSFVWEFMYPRS
jgi:hypothetical protein